MNKNQKILPHIKPRRNFIQNIIDCHNHSIKILEIGAFAVPTFFKSEAQIMFMDQSSKEELVATIESDPEKCARVVDVDFVVKKKNFSACIDLKFNLIIANHVVEHIPDLISWFGNISNLLLPQGIVFLSVPHKEYTFDKLRRLTSLTEILAAYEADLVEPTIYQVFDHIYFRRPIMARDVWNDDYTHLLDNKTFKSAKDALDHIKMQKKSGEELEAHCSVFNCQSFLDICNELAASRYIDLEIISYKDVERPYNEFFVALRRK